MISDETEKELLAHEELMTKIIRARSPDRPKPWWEKAGVIPAGTAVLTVLVTSLAGYFTQKALKDKENRFEIVGESTKLAREAAARANSAIAGQLKLNEERLLSAKGSFRQLTPEQENAISSNTNRLQQEWRQQREDVELELYLVFDSVSGVVPAWRQTREALDKRTLCVEDAYSSVAAKPVSDPNRYLTVPVCVSEIAASDSAVAGLRRSMKHGYQLIRNAH